MSGVGPHGLPPFEEIATALCAEAPRRWGLVGRRSLGLLAEPATSSIWLVVPRGDAPTPASPTKAISVRELGIGGSPHLLVGSSGFAEREVYYFICSLVARLEDRAEELTSALEGELAAWSALLSPSPSMDSTSQLGLLGELWVLWRVISASGARVAIRSWTGPLAEPHDFRLQSADLEVKATLATKRDHTINGLSQLTPDGTRPLSIVSLQLKPSGAGPGTSLSAAVEALEHRIGGDSASISEFRRILLAHGYREADRERYSTRFSMRSSPMLVAVDSLVPRITRESVKKLITSETAQRFIDATYRINLDGLGRDMNGAHEVLLPKTTDADLYD